MKATTLYILLFLCFVNNWAFAAKPEAINFYRQNTNTLSVKLDDVQHIALDKLQLIVVDVLGHVWNFAYEDVSNITFGQYEIPNQLELSETSGLNVYIRNNETLIVQSTDPIQTVQLMDMKGLTTMIDFGDCSKQEVQVSLSELSKGVYVVRVHGSQSIGVRKVVVK